MEGGRLFKICESSSQIRILGQVVCKLWLNPKASIQMASEAIMQDIMRSLSTRLDMHWDSLTEEEHGEGIFVYIYTIIQIGNINMVMFSRRE